MTDRNSDQFDKEMRRQAISTFPARAGFSAGGWLLRGALPAAFGLWLLSAPTSAQTTAETPAADALAHQPDFEVAWPELAPEPPRAQGTEPPAEAVRPPAREWAPAGQALRYTVSVSGLDGLGLESRFRDLSLLLEERGETATRGQIESRARDDVGLLRRLLESQGYYGGEIDYEVEPIEGETGRLRITFTVYPGPRYTFSEIRLPAPPGAPDALIRENFILQPQDPIVAADILAAENRLRLALPQSGYPFSELGPRDVLIDDRTDSGIYTLPVEPGPRAVFGGFQQEGDRLFGSDHLALLARFDRNELYDVRDVEDLRQALIATGLFSTVAIRPVATDATTATGETIVDLEVTTEEGPLRTLAGSIGYSTGEGIRAEALWRHRNLLPPEGAVTFRALAGTREQRLGAELRRNNFRRRDQVLFGLIEAARQDYDAYNARILNLAARIERLTNLIWQKRWTYSYGVELQASQERDNGSRQTFFIAAVPLQLGYDGSNDLLDPRRGFRLSGRLSPELAHQDGAFTYARALVDASGYVPLRSDNLVLAGRLRLGSIVGADTDRIAPTRRFYAGGGGSVRGFGFQEIGPRDAEGDPLGGRSLVEASLELRYRFGDFGIVPFIDAGQLYSSTLPRFSGWRFGAGIGGRYYTGFGPIRLDVATPLNPRDGDPAIGVYISIGQAF